MSSVKDKEVERPSEGCLTRSVADSLAEEPSLEAVTIDPARRKISVATLGRVDVEQITQRVTRKIQSAREADAGGGCSLLSGKGDCAVCDSPLSAEERSRITIQRAGKGEQE